MFAFSLFRLLPFCLFAFLPFAFFFFSFIIFIRSLYIFVHFATPQVSSAPPAKWTEYALAVGHDSGSTPTSNIFSVFFVIVRGRLRKAAALPPAAFRSLPPAAVRTAAGGAAGGRAADGCGRLQAEGKN